MKKKGRIIAGLIIFLAPVTIPIYYNWGKKNTKPNINVNPTAIQNLNKKQCIESTEYMRANHMKLLLQWRDDVVRKGDRIYVNSRGESYQKDINTCLNCHNDPTKPVSQQFCVTCHDYASVKPDCRQCHSWPGVNEHTGTKS